MTAGNTRGFHELWIYLRIVTTFREVPLEHPGKNTDIKSIRENLRMNPNKTFSGCVVEGFSWLYTEDRFRQREICMAEWGILEEGAHKLRYCIYTHTCP